MTQNVNILQMSLLRVFSYNVLLKSIKIIYSAPLFISKMPFYAVAKGRTSGIFMTWPDCEAQVKGFPGARYKKFDSVVSAQDFISAEGAPSSSAKSKKPIIQPKPDANSTSNLKRTFSTSSNNQSVSEKPKRKSEASAGYAKEKNDSDGDFSDYSDDLNTILSKQMDDIEKRLKTFEKGVDKIMKKGTKKTILIEPPQNKRQKTSGGAEFDTDNSGYVQVYTDGACSANGKSGARAGLGVYWGDGHPLNISEPVSGRATNNCGEIQAATRAIKVALQNGVNKLSINTDSKFVINSVTKWMPGAGMQLQPPPQKRRVPPLGQHSQEPVRAATATAQKQRTPSNYTVEIIGSSLSKQRRRATKLATPTES